VLYGGTWSNSPTNEIIKHANFQIPQSTYTFVIFNYLFKNQYLLDWRQHIYENGFGI
jgi:hypothetical protein